MNSLSWTFVGKLDSQNDLAGAMLTQNGLPKSQSKSLLLEHTDGDGQCPKMSVKLHQDWVFFSPGFGVILIQIYLKDNCIISICSIISYSFIIYPTFFWPQKLLFLGQLVMSMVQTLMKWWEFFHEVRAQGGAIGSCGWSQGVGCPVGEPSWRFPLGIDVGEFLGETGCSNLVAKPQIWGLCVRYVRRKNCSSPKSQVLLGRVGKVVLLKNRLVLALGFARLLQLPWLLRWRS